LFQELAARSPHRQGGAEKVIQDIEAREAEEEAKKRAEFDDYQTHLYRDGFRLYRKKIGLGRTFHHAPGVLSPKEV
jgi:hypothetical protein